MKKIPKKIDNCPIYDATLEIRFEPTNPLTPAIGLFGPLFSEIDTAFSTKDNKIKFGQLPIANLPESIRNQDPILREKPSLKIDAEPYTIQIGARVVSISVNKEYVGWVTFLDKIVRLLGILEKAQFIEKVTRVGYRCLNFFEKPDVMDVFAEGILEIRLQQNNAPLGYEQMGLNLSRELATGIGININISNNVSMVYKGLPKEGSAIDLDTYANNPRIVMTKFSASMMDVIEAIHSGEKAAFYDLLEEQFVKDKLRPTYE